MVCGLCNTAFKAGNGIAHHRGFHQTAVDFVNKTLQASGKQTEQVAQPSPELVRRVRYAIKRAILRQAAGLAGNRAKRRAVVSIDCTVADFVHLFGRLPQLMLSRRHERCNHFTIKLLGTNVFTVLDPILGLDWFVAETKRRDDMVYVRAVCPELDRSFPFDISFTHLLEKFVEETENGTLHEYRYDIGDLQLSFSIGASSHRQQPEPTADGTNGQEMQL